MASFSKFVKVCVRKGGGGNSKVVSYKYKGAAPYAVALYLPGIFNTESGSVDEACKKKRTCIGLL